MNVRRLAFALASTAAALALAAPAASAHPLGNFTINHYSGLRVAPTDVIVDHVLDFAEVPAFSERRALDTDTDGTVSTAEAATGALERCSALTDDLSLTVDGAVTDLRPTHTGLSFPMGQGAPTMRLVCVYEAPLAAPVSGPTSISFSDTSYAERLGWREIVVVGDGVRIAGAEGTSLSARLTSYPSDLLAVPLGQRTAAFTATAGGPALAPFSVPDASPVEPGAPAPVAEQPLPAGAAPAGVTDLGAEVTALFQAPDLTPPIILLSLLVAVALGALHALSPGHGKTVMAAYLVGSRGTTRQAVGLGLTVTVSHTLGVLALGTLSLSASALIPPERLYPILGVVSGAIVIVIGAYLLLQRLRATRATRATPHDHHHPPGWHEHDGIGHTHVPAEPQMGKRGLFALGLSGGMIPSVSALLILLGSITIGRPEFGIVLTVAFGLGMAVVLVGIGLALVYARNWFERMPRRGRGVYLGERLPLVTACIVLVAGVLITGQALTSLG